MLIDLVRVGEESANIFCEVSGFVLVFKVFVKIVFFLKLIIKMKKNKHVFATVFEFLLRTWLILEVCNIIHAIFIILL